MIKLQRHTRLRRGSVYIAVSGTAVLVSLVGFTAMHVSRLELDRATVQSERTYARQLAQSGVEFAMAAIDLDSNWRNNYSHNVMSSRNPMGVDENIRFRFLDRVDGNLGNNSDDPVEIQGIGQFRSSKFIYSVTYATSVTGENQVGPLVIRSYEGGVATQDPISSSAFMGQHFFPNLPAEATSWNISQIDIYLEKDGGTGSTLAVNLYNSDANGKPGTLIESVSVAEASLPGGPEDWYPVTFSSATGLTPGQGYSFTIEHVSGGSAAIVHYDTGVTQTDTHLLRGGPGWCNADSNQSLQYRINGTYTTSTSSGDFTITPGSWRATVAQ